MAQPFILYSVSQKNSITNQLNMILREWCTTWLGSEAVSCELTEVQESDRCDLEKYALEIEPAKMGVIEESGQYFDKDEHVIIACDKNNLKNLVSKLFVSSDVPNVYTQEQKFLISECYGDLKKRLNGGNNKDIKSKAVSFVKGCGWCFCVVHIEDVSLNLALDLTIIRQLIELPSLVTNKKSGLTSLSKAIVNGELVLNAVVASLDLTLGELQQLQVGDVIRLDKNIDETIPLCNSAGETVFSGYLGKQNNHKAIMLARK